MSKKTKKKGMGIFGWISYALAIVAMINWGLVSWFNIDLVSLASFGKFWIERTLKTIVAVAGIYLIIVIPKLIKKR